MSWGVSAVGKPPAVLASIEKQFSQSSCAEPEETVRQSARAAIKAALEAQRPDSIVQVIASGHQIGTYDADTKLWGAPFQNQLEVKVLPLGGYVE
jgi:superfamily II helicase